MSGDVTFALATRADDAAIRQLLARNPMPGRIRLRFEREPDYFAGLPAMGPFTQVLVARSRSKAVGVACRAVRRLYVNGREEEVGYLGQLRVDRSFRGRQLVSRGFRMLRELHADGRARGYLTTIIDGNDEAHGVLVRRPRRGMPVYRFLDHLLTLAIRVRPGPATLISAADAAAFLAIHGPRRNGFPVYEDKPLDFIGIERNGRLAGVSALWDQRASKQTVVDGYAPAIAFARPLYNLAARMTGRPSLPPAGSALRSAFASFFALADDDPAVARRLIAAVLALAAARGLDHVLFGFTQADPLLAVARAFRPIEYRSSIYTVSWDDQDDLHDRLQIPTNARPLTLDLATL